MEVVSATRQAQELSDTAAAVYVITAQDIAASSATTIPELLVSVPGIHAAQINASNWAVSARDFNGRFSNKLLVLIDGRSIYTPLFSGVFWERYDLVLADIERIEIIRGPGGSVWGANAVNGIINIITKRASDTRGTFVEAIAGTNERVGTLRQGGTLGEVADYRVFLKMRQHDSQEIAPGIDGLDDWRSLTAGFRLDAGDMNSGELRIDGDIFFAEYGDTVSEPIFVPPFIEVSTRDTTAHSYYLAGSWARTLSPRSTLELHAFYAYSQLENLRLGDSRHILDLEAQHSFALNPLTTFIWGGGLRQSWDKMTNSDTITFQNLNETRTIYNAFGQVSSELLDHRLIVTAGSKFEHNEDTGFEIQPTARALWRFDENHKMWAAVSRAVRTPSRAENNIQVTAASFPGTVNPPTLPGEIRFTGNDDLQSENLVALEAGYRGQMTEGLTFDFAAYRHEYDDLIYANQVGAPFVDPGPPARTVFPLTVSNATKATSWGVEAAVNWQPLTALRFELTYGYVDASIRDASGPVRQTSPHHQLSLRTLYQLNDELSTAVTARYIGRTPASNLGNYIDLDIVASWSLSESLEIDLVGRNLFAGRTAEFAPEFDFAGNGTFTAPSGYIALTWRN